jgi:hypothetical protein
MDTVINVEQGYRLIQTHKNKTWPAIKYADFVLFDPKTLFIYLLPLGEVGSNRLLDPLKVHTEEALDIWALVMQEFFQAQEGTQMLSVCTEMYLYTRYE